LFCVDRRRRLRSERWSAQLVDQASTRLALLDPARCLTERSREITTIGLPRSPLQCGKGRFFEGHADLHCPPCSVLRHCPTRVVQRGAYGQLLGCEAPTRFFEAFQREGTSLEEWRAGAALNVRSRHHRGISSSRDARRFLVLASPFGCLEASRFRGGPLLTYRRGFWRATDELEPEEKRRKKNKAKRERRRLHRR